MASTYLSRTYGTPTNNKIWTLSFWVKRAELGREQHILNGGGQQFYFSSGDVLAFGDTGGTQLVTSQVFRDVSAWYNIIISTDTTQATASDRVKMYVNGTQVTSFSTSTYPTINSSSSWNTASTAYYIGSYNPAPSGLYFNGLMTHVHFIDGTAYDASAFGETDATTGIWKAKTAPSVTYGTNGFFLKFENSGSMGTDSSSNGNNFTVNGTMTQTIDTPSNVFATYNPLNSNVSYPVVFAYGNTDIASQNNLGFFQGSSTLGASQGKWYMEMKVTSTGHNVLGISYDPSELARSNSFVGSSTSSYGYYQDNGNYFTNSSGSAYGDTFTTGDIISIAMDLDNSYLYFAKNGTWQNGGVPTSGATGTGAKSITSGQTYFFCCSDGSGAFFSTSQANFGNGYFGTTPVASAQNPDDGIGIFEYTVPTGYKALCTKSINAQEYD